MAKKWIQKAVKHPGRLTEAAHRAGVSKLQQAEKWSHSSDPSKRAAGNLGKRFIKGKMHEGGVVPEDGAYEMKAGEQVIPAPETTESGIKVPTGSESRSSVESVSSTPNKGDVMDAQPTVDGGECGVGHWEGDCKDIKFVK